MGEGLNCFVPSIHIHEKYVSAERSCCFTCAFCDNLVVEWMWKLESRLELKGTDPRSVCSLIGRCASVAASVSRVWSKSSFELHRPPHTTISICSLFQFTLCTGFNSSPHTLSIHGFNCANFPTVGSIKALILIVISDCFFTLLTCKGYFDSLPPPPVM